MRLAPVLLLFAFLHPLSVAAQVGMLDPAFDGDGIRTDSLSAQDHIWHVLALDNGSILALGSSENDGPTTRDARLTRYAPDGSLDESWPDPFDGCPGGPGTPGAYLGGVVEPSGDVLTISFNQYGCSGAERDFILRRIDPETGQILAEADRPVFHGFSEEPWGGLVRLPDGAIVAGGYACNGTPCIGATRDLAFVRYNADFSIDTAFGTDGEVLIDVAGDYDILYDLVVQPDGKIIGGGSTFDGTQYDWLLVRLNPDGSLDESFGTGGLVIQDIAGFNDGLNGLVLQPDGTLVVVGAHIAAAGTSPIFTVGRYSADGTLDPSFGTAGLATIDFTGQAAGGQDVLLQADGKLLVAGFTETGAGGLETRDFAIARLLPDGSLDPSFGTGGRTVTDIAGGLRDHTRGAALMPDGDVVVVGYTEREVDGTTLYDAALARFIGDTPPVATEPTAEQPSGADLSTASPNPFAERTTLRYRLAAPGRVRLAVYDALGREVAVLAQGARAAGRHTAVFDGAGLPSGTYLVRLVAGTQIQTQRVTLLK